MIRIAKNYDKPPKKLQEKNAEEKRKQVLREGKQHKASENFYSSKPIKEALEIIYQNKCGYCEDYTGTLFPVDHFRPKGSLKEDKNHPGYYWLTYEWSNLINSCTDCNGKKLNQFPIQGSRIKKPQEDRKEWLANSPSFSSENSLLLNPELDNPEEHFTFYADGRIETKNGSLQGETTIQVCQLNREKLKQSRKRVVDEIRLSFVKQFNLCFTFLESNGTLGTKKTQEYLDICFESQRKVLVEKKKSKYNFSRLRWHMLQDFEAFFLLNQDLGLSLKQQKILTEAYHKFLKKIGITTNDN